MVPCSPSGDDADVRTKFTLSPIDTELAPDAVGDCGVEDADKLDSDVTLVLLIWIATVIVPLAVFKLYSCLILNGKVA